LRQPGCETAPAFVVSEPAPDKNDPSLVGLGSVKPRRPGLFRPLKATSQSGFVYSGVSCGARPAWRSEQNWWLGLSRRTREREPPFVMLTDPEAKLLAALDRAEDYRGLAIRCQDRREREVYERIVELYVEIAEQLERLLDK